MAFVDESRSCNSIFTTQDAPDTSVEQQVTPKAHFLFVVAAAAATYFP